MRPGHARRAASSAWPEAGLARRSGREACRPRDLREAKVVFPLRRTAKGGPSVPVTGDPFSRVPVRFHGVRRHARAQAQRGCGLCQFQSKHVPHLGAPVWVSSWQYFSLRQGEIITMFIGYCKDYSLFHSLRTPESGPCAQAPGRAPWTKPSGNGSLGLPCRPFDGASLWTARRAKRTTAAPTPRRTGTNTLFGSSAMRQTQRLASRGMGQDRRHLQSGACRQRAPA